MNVERFVRRAENGKLIQAGERFPLLIWEAWLEYRTNCSAGFEVGTARGPNGFSRNVKGHVDVHYPCEGHIKVRIRCQLPLKVGFAEMHTAVDQVLEAVGIPLDETYEAHFYTADNQLVINQYVDREGRSDRMVSTTRWHLKGPDHDTDT